MIEFFNCLPFENTGYEFVDKTLVVRPQFFNVWNGRALGVEIVFAVKR